jgi:hypothetical protein
MITAATTSVYVRVDLPSLRVISVSDEPLVARENQPVFTVASNSPRLDYYIVEKNAAATYGITVRAATTEERAAADAKLSANAAVVTQRIKEQKAVYIKEFFCNIFMRRFLNRGFMGIDEINCAVSYSGNDATMLNTIKPLAITIQNAGNEWRHLVCQPVIDAMYADATGTGVELDDIYRTQTEDSLDTFLTERGFDVAVYHR